MVLGRGETVYFKIICLTVLYMLLSDLHDSGFYYSLPVPALHQILKLRKQAQHNYL